MTVKNITTDLLEVSGAVWSNSDSQSNVICPKNESKEYNKYGLLRDTIIAAETNISCLPTSTA